MKTMPLSGSKKNVFNLLSSLKAHQILPFAFAKWCTAYSLIVDLM